MFIPDLGVKKTLDSGSATLLRLEMGSRGSKIRDWKNFGAPPNPKIHYYSAELIRIVCTRYNLQGFALL
jgi:hypothetical protein